VMPRPARSIFIVLLALYPKSSRDSFGTEMLQTIEEAAGDFGITWLLCDGLLSATRQRLVSLFREEADCQAWSVAGLRSGQYPFTGPSDMNAMKLMLAAFLSTILFDFIAMRFEFMFSR